MSIDNYVKNYINENRNTNKYKFEIIEELKEGLKKKCGYRFDLRTIHGKEIYDEVMEGLGRK